MVQIMQKKREIMHGADNAGKERMIHDNDKGYGRKGGGQSHNGVKCTSWTDREDVTGHIKTSAAGDRGIELCF